MSHDWEATCRALFEAQGMMHTLGATLRSLRPGHVEIEAPIRPEVSQQHGYGHAGLAWTLGDSASGFSAQTLLQEGQGVLTTEMKINLLSPAIGETLVARGQVEKAGRRLIVTRSDVYAESATGERHVAIMLGTMMVMEERG